jgi:hypothetical protein
MGFYSDWSEIKVLNMHVGGPNIADQVDVCFAVCCHYCVGQFRLKYGGGA